jgi:hypothetical protein
VAGIGVAKGTGISVVASNDSELEHADMIRTGKSVSIKCHEKFFLAG